MTTATTPVQVATAVVAMTVAMRRLGDTVAAYANDPIPERRQAIEDASRDCRHALDIVDALVVELPGGDR